ncbi:MAG: Heterocyst differentiation ATP-binding protein HepA [Chlamydiia bacterium]|nr:Heterocyst differentiation ATP-binding protein HepA [Chlamydiia bacterium]MCH9616436.1 Heterocyst differentiation ATP-binding protein HepA [Chlamydiia bacterium]MCH9629578.1 Heterocyst differentiation ATP-binding protein HepA [Chlamydiia bacterium]
MRKLFFGEKNKNLYIFLISLIPNVLAAALEGLSYGCIMLAFGVFNKQEGLFQSHKILINISNYFHLERFTNLELFIICLLGGIVLQILRSLFTYVCQVINTFVGTNIQVVAQEKVYEKILSFSYPYVSEYKVGDLVEYAKTPSYLFHPLIDGVNRILIGIFTVLASFYVMVLLSPSLTLLAVVLFGSFALLQKMIIRKLSHISASLLTHTVDFTKHIVQNLHAMRVIHTFHRQKHTRNCISGILQDITKATMKSGLYNHAMVPLNEVMIITCVGIFLLIGMVLPSQSGSPMASTILLTFVTVAYRLNGRLQMMIQGVSTVATNWAHINRLEHILSDEGKEFAPSGGRPCKTFEQSIKLSNVSLQYKSAHEPSLQGLNIEINKGESIAFVGTSGAGKSSIMDLLIRLYDPTEGSVLLDGEDLSQFDLEGWRNQLAVVSQDAFIFNDTIEANIRFGLLSATREQVEEAARLAHANIFIDKLPDGYDTLLGERGYRLSGGEKQRIALARAMVRRAEILILDEATSNLDSHSEKHIQAALADYSKNRTVITVAHRLSTITTCDKIYVLENGSLVETGSHDELLASPQKYASFWHAQSKHPNELVEV